ncbi:MAG: hypothetical protein ACFFD2_15250 [Promethearchaeota archaeon]
MIKLIVEKNVKKKHYILCPHCQRILNLVSKIQTSLVPGGITFRVDLFKEEDSLTYEKKEELSLELLEA